jgi:hypothetical protein
MNKLSLLGLASALLILSNLEAKASMVTLDWSTVPQGHLQTLTPGPNGVYTTGSDFSGVGITVAGSNFAPAGLHRPKVEDYPYPVPVLSTVANFKPSGSATPTVTFTIDFFGYKQGVRNVDFMLFNLDADKKGKNVIQDVVTFQTAGLTLTGGKDNVVSSNTVTGTADSGPESTDSPGGNVTVRSGNLPLHQIVFTSTQLAEPSKFLDQIAIGNITFTPVPEVGQLAIGLVACLVGALWLRTKRIKRANSLT